MGQTVNLLVYNFGGSNPSSPTSFRGSSSVDRASAFQAEGREFEPRLPLQRFRKRHNYRCLCSSGVEHFLGKEEVAGSNPAIGSKVEKLIAPIVPCHYRGFTSKPTFSGRLPDSCLGHPLFMSLNPLPEGRVRPTSRD